jgi:hypothetical protein
MANTADPRVEVVDEAIGAVWRAADRYLKGVQSHPGIGDICQRRIGLSRRRPNTAPFSELDPTWGYRRSTASSLTNKVVGPELPNASGFEAVVWKKAGVICIRLGLNNSLWSSKCVHYKMTVGSP